MRAFGAAQDDAAAAAAAAAPAAGAVEQSHVIPNLISRLMAEKVRRATAVWL